MSGHIPQVAAGGAGAAGGGGQGDYEDVGDYGEEEEGLAGAGLGNYNLDPQTMAQI